MLTSGGPSAAHFQPAATIVAGPADLLPMQRSATMQIGTMHLAANRATLAGRNWKTFLACLPISSSIGLAEFSRWSFAAFEWQPGQLGGKFLVGGADSL